MTTYQRITKQRRQRRMQKRRKLHSKIFLVVALITLLGLLVYGASKKTTFEFFVKAEVEPKVVKVEVPVEKLITKTVVVDNGNKVDEVVDKYAKIYSYGSLDRYSELKAVLHCLFYFESKHTAASGFGDNGKAGGPLQFWEGTYTNFRKIMMEKGLTDHIGSRMDLEDAVETTTWALADGRGRNWGPILRGECILP